MGYQDELWFQNLEEWIFDESKLVTYKYVAASLKIHVNAAKKMLYTFNKESSRKTFAVYLVVGSINEECHIRLIADKGIEKEEAKFDKVLSKHVYALGQPSIYDENDLSGMLHLGFTINSVCFLKDRPKIFDYKFVYPTGERNLRFFYITLSVCFFSFGELVIFIYSLGSKWHAFEIQAHHFKASEDINKFTN